MMNKNPIATFLGVNPGRHTLTIGGHEYQIYPAVDGTGEFGGTFETMYRLGLRGVGGFTLANVAPDQQAAALGHFLSGYASGLKRARMEELGWRARREVAGRNWSA